MRPMELHAQETRSQLQKAGPLPKSGESLFAALRAFPANVRSEESDTYAGIVAILTPRLIRSRCNLQWIAQRQNGTRNGAPIWSSFAFCATREGLLLRLPKNGQRCDRDAWAVIDALPDFFPK